MAVTLGPVCVPTMQPTVSTGALVGYSGKACWSRAMPSSLKAWP